MKTLILSILFAGAVFGQSLNTVNIIPVSGAASQIRFWDNARTNYIGLISPAALSGNSLLSLPPLTGSPGCWQDSTGTGVTVIGSCVAPPIYVSGGNVGIGNTPGSFLLDVFGAENLHGNLSLSADNSFNLFGPSLAPAATFLHNLNADQRTVLGALVTQNAASTPTWFITGGAGQTSGNSYWQDVTSRYVFNSQGDVPQTGTVNITTGGVVTSSVAVFDVSWAGGQLNLGSPPIPYTILSPVTSATSISLCTVASTTCLHPYAAGPQTGVSFSYLANAFQTSLGTTYTTGTGFGYFQSLSTAFGFTAYTTAGARTGSVSCSGTSAFQTGGAPFDLSMAGNTVTISGVPIVVTSVMSTSQIILASGCTSGAYSWTQKPFALDNDAFFVDITGTGFFNGGIATGPSSDSIIYVGSVGNFFNRTFTGGAPLCSGIGDGWQGVNTTTPALWFCSGGAAYSAGGGGGAVSSVTGSGSGISVSPTTGSVIVSNTGVTSLSAGTGISLSGSTGAVTITNTASGVTGSGTTGTIPIWTGSTALGNSPLSVVGGALTSSDAIVVNGSVTVTSGGVFIANSSATINGLLTANAGLDVTTGTTTLAGGVSGTTTFSGIINATGGIASNVGINSSGGNLLVSGGAFLVDPGVTATFSGTTNLNGTTAVGGIGISNSSGIFVIGAGAQASSFRVPGFVVIDASANVSGATVTTASHFAVNSTAGITSSTCSHWTGGICDTP